MSAAPTDAWPSADCRDGSMAVPRGGHSLNAFLYLTALVVLISMSSEIKLTERKFASQLSAGPGVVVAGWLQDTRNLGGIAFLQVRDRTGITQVTALKKKLGDDVFSDMTSIPRESVVAFKGEVKANEQARSGVELVPEAFEVLSEAATPLPLGIIDKVGADLDTRLNNRFLDLRKSEIATIFTLRDIILREVRSTLTGLGFIEVSTPKIVAAGAEGGATLFKLDYFGKPAYLAQSSQLYKQVLMSSGFDRIFEIAPAFRAEQSDTVRHIAEFGSLDVEMSFIDSSDDIMDVLEEMIVAIMKALDDEAGDEIRALNPNFRVPDGRLRRLTYAEAKDMLAADGIHLKGDLDTEAEKGIGRIMGEKHGEDLYFITSFPTELKIGTFYARRNDDNPELTGYFDMDYRGQEIVSGGMREHRIEKLLCQMNEAGLNPDAFEFYLKAFRYGMPPHGGFGFGIERFLQMILDLPNIRECVLFPRDMHRLEP